MTDESTVSTFIPAGRRGFTLVELLVVVAIIGILSGMSPPVSCEIAIAANQGDLAEQGMMGLDSKTSFSKVTDGLSRTVMREELSWKDVNCYRPWFRGLNASNGSHSKALFPID